MGVTLSDAARRYIALFEDVTDVAARDCLVDDEYDRVVYLVPPGDMARAIGPNGRHVKAVEERLGRRVELVEDADTPEAFVANALAPAAVYNVTISRNRDVVAYAEVAQEDRGVAIGVDGRNIERARTLARRHFDVADVELT
ncbi:NusA-like transcription termination signal-binding factor [Halomarina pelagica]|uniref:NusA-like transcription termination signal-binding factor n=1 Tax=Halomarina pelagica TaxID=2961599 RepID=UPI0020C50F85|nr:NusA-like transcription termination signal-binding factor [Halomarina sp. BND7]